MRSTQVWIHITNYVQASQVNKDNNMQLRDDFAKHTSELNDPLERPYSKDIDYKLFDNIEDV